MAKLRGADHVTYRLQHSGVSPAPCTPLKEQIGSLYQLNTLTHKAEERRQQTTRVHRCPHVSTSSLLRAPPPHDHARHTNHLREECVVHHELVVRGPADAGEGLHLPQRVHGGGMYTYLHVLCPVNDFLVYVLQ